MKRFVSFLLTIVMLLAVLPLGSSFATNDEFSVTISFEGLTLGQGMYIEPVRYTLSEINDLIATEGYGPYDEDELTAAMVTLAVLIDNDTAYKTTGDWESSIYLSDVYGFDTGVIDIPSIITENGGPSNDDNNGNFDEYLGEFDYSNMSGWMITVNHLLIPVGSSQYYVEDGSVIRWHFTLWGYGADLGLGTSWGMPAFFQAANKDALYAAYAVSDNAEAKANALAVMTNLTATQAEVDAALEELTAPVDTPAQDVSAVLNEALTQLANTVTEPAFGTLGGEWSVLCLARSNYYDKNSEYFAQYYNRIVQTVQELAASVNMNGALHNIKSTENSRLILALSSIGRSAESVGGWNLIAPFNDFSWVTRQGINGPVFALIALDTHNYQTSNTEIRQQCIDYILNHQLADGGWCLTGTTADPDITSMTLQALSTYSSSETVRNAIERGINCLSALQRDNGGYASWGSINSESIAQVIVACTALGINPDTDPRFIKNGNSVVDALLSFYDSESKIFCHVIDDGGNAMATDQAIYALVAYKRFMTGQASLYNMSDVEFIVPEGLTAHLGIPAEISNTPGTEFNAVISLDGWDNEAVYKLMDCIVAVPDGVTVTNVTMGDRISGGQVSYNFDETEGKLRIVYFDPQSNSDLHFNGEAITAECFNIAFRTERVIETESLYIAVSGMSMKLLSDPFNENSMIIVNTDNAYGSIALRNSISFSVGVLYQGDGVDLIPENKQAICVAVANIAEDKSIAYDDGNNAYSFYFSPEITEKTGVASYVALVDADAALEGFIDEDNYTIGNLTSAAAINFGDTNSDGVVNAQDALNTVNSWLRKSEVSTDKDILIQNINADSRINTFDALGIVEAFVNGNEYIIIGKAAMVGATIK